MKTTYTIEVDLDGNVVTTMTTVRSIEEYLAEATKVHAFATEMQYRRTPRAALITEVKSEK